LLDRRKGFGVNIKIGTRSSPLALAQAYETRDKLLVAYGDVDIEIVPITTTGDRVQDRPLSDVGGKGVFTKELDEALFDRRINVAVHSMKDVPTWLPDGIILAAMFEREDVRDVLVSPEYNHFSQMPAGSVIGTTSLRRQSQILARYPELKVVIFRGNVQTRLRKLSEGVADATLLALAGLKRLECTDVAARILEPDELLPAVGQGAIGLACRDDDENVTALLRGLDHAPTSRCVLAERAMLGVLDGSCKTPIAGLATLSDNDQTITLKGLVAQADGSEIWQVEDHGPAADSDQLGRAVGAKLRALVGEDFFAALAD
jgi:hydroxymethylbilane synthase